MKTITIDAKSKTDAIKQCVEKYGWTPDAVRRVDSGNANPKAFKCFESAQDAETWDKQK